MNLDEFKQKLKDYDDLGREATLKHLKQFPKPTDKEKKIEGAGRFHAAGTDYKCPLCKKIIDNFNAYQKLTADTFGMTGIDYQSLISAIRITEVVVRMMMTPPEETKEVKTEVKK